jgi:hypothetical protein
MPYTVGQPQSGSFAFFFGREEGFENMGEGCTVHAFPGVADRQVRIGSRQQCGMGHRAVGCDEQNLRGHRECPAGRHGIFRVYGQIQHHLIDLSSVCANRAGLRVQISDQADVFADQPFDHRTDGRERLIEIEDLERQHLAPAEGQKLLGQGRRSLARGQDLRSANDSKWIFGPYLFQHERGALR